MAFALFVVWANGEDWCGRLKEGRLSRACSHGTPAVPRGATPSQGRGYSMSKHINMSRRSFVGASATSALALFLAACG